MPPHALPGDTLVAAPDLPWTSFCRLAPRPLPATWVERPHRFAAWCRLPTGELVEAHLPNPGRLTGTAAPGRAVLLDGPAPAHSKRSLRYTVLAIREASAWVGCVTGLANEALPSLLAAGLLPELPKALSMRREVVQGDSRFDWQLIDPSGAPFWLECKSATMRRAPGAIAFPDAVTARGTRHLRGLIDLQRQGQRCGLLFVVQRADGRVFSPADDIDPSFGETLREAASVGVLILAASLQLGPRGYRPRRRLQLSLAFPPA